MNQQEKFVFTVRHGQRADFVHHEPIGDKKSADVKFITNSQEFLADP